MFASTLMFKVVRQSGTEAGCRRQEMLFPENYQSEAGWAIYGDGDCADDQKLLAMAKRLRALGTTRLSEKSLGNAAMCALYKNGPSSTDALLNTRKLKFFLLSQHQPMQIQGPAVYPRYPRAPETLQTTHLALWHQIDEDGAIVQSKVAEFDMATIKSTVACRSTKSGSNLPAYGGHRQIHTAPMPKQMAGLMRPMGRPTNGWAYATDGLGLCERMAFLDDGTQCRVFGQGCPENPYAIPPRCEPSMFRPNMPGFATPLGMPPIMDRAASAGTQASAQEGCCEDGQGFGDGQAGPPVLGSVLKKVAVKTAKALQVQSHGILFCHTTLNHI